MPQPDAYRGGNCNNDLKVGAFYCNLNNLATNANWNIGASESYLRATPHRSVSGQVWVVSDPHQMVEMNLMQAPSSRQRTRVRG